MNPLRRLSIRAGMLSRGMLARIMYMRVWNVGNE